MSFNDEQIQFFNKFLVRFYKNDTGAEQFVWSEFGLTWEDYENEYDGDMKKYYQKIIDNPIDVGVCLHYEIFEVGDAFADEYRSLFESEMTEEEFYDDTGVGEPNIMLYCQSLTLEDLFVILQEAMDMELNEIFEMYGLDYVMPK
jgi:hypothetical protein